MSPSRLTVRALGCAVWLTLTSPSPGHPIIVNSAEFDVGAQRTILRITVSGEDLLHVHELPQEADERVTATALTRCAAAHGELLLRDVIVRDVDGRRLPARLRGIDPPDFGSVPLSWTAVRAARLVFTLEVDVDRPSHLSFQQLCGTRTRFVPWAMSAIVSQAGRAERIALRLTNGGNVETVGFDWTGATAPCGPAAFNQLRAEITVHARHVDLDVDIPLPVLETWLPVEREDPDFIDAPARAALLPRIRTLLLEHNDVMLNDAVASAEVAAVHLEGLGGPPATDAPLSTWTGRVRSTVRYHGAAPIDRLAMTWTLFNNVVLAQPIEVHTPDGSAHQRLSTYAPLWTWTRQR